MRASSPSRALGLLAAVAVAQAPLAAPSLAHAAGPGSSSSSPSSSSGSGSGSSSSSSASSAGTSSSAAPGADTPPAREPPADPTDAPPPAPISAEAVQTGKEPPPPVTPTLGKPLHDAPRPGASNQPAIVAPANNVSPVSPTAGMGGRLMSTTDPEARRAKAELEGTSLAKNPSADVPKRLPPQQRGAWWSMFGAFALGSAAGVFAGLAEVQEDKATRLAITLDSTTGSALVYADHKAEYEKILSVGRRDAAVARGLIAGAGGFLVAGVVLFIVHAVHTRKAEDAKRRVPSQLPAPSAPTTSPTPARVGLGRGGLEVRF